MAYRNPLAHDFASARQKPAQDMSQGAKRASVPPTSAEANDEPPGRVTLGWKEFKEAWRDLRRSRG